MRCAAQFGSGENDGEATFGARNIGSADTSLHGVWVHLLPREAAGEIKTVAASVCGAEQFIDANVDICRDGAANGSACRRTDLPRRSALGSGGDVALPVSSRLLEHEVNSRWIRLRQASGCPEPRDEGHSAHNPKMCMDRGARPCRRLANPPLVTAVVVAPAPRRRASRRPQRLRAWIESG